MPKMKILIVGAGIGGLTLASFLENSDIEYDIIERCKDWSHLGYSMSIWNNGRNILNKLGLAEIFDKNSTRISNYNIYNGKGGLLRTYNLKDFISSYGISLNLVQRKDLHDWLSRKITKTKIQMGTEVASITQNKDNTSVTFSNGKIEAYDLVVGADGIHSKTRSIIFPKYKEPKGKWRVWWMWVDNKFKTESSVNEYIEPNEFISLFDSGEKTLAIIASLNSKNSANKESNVAEKLKSIFRDEKIVSPEIFDNLKDSDVASSELIHIDLANWFKGNVVLLGDSAHAFEPYAGIGGSMALEDAYVLAGELIRVSSDATYNLNQALKTYQDLRKRRVSLALKLTNKMRFWALIKSRLLRRAVDFIIPYFPEKYFVRDYNKLLKEEI